MISPTPRSACDHSAKYAAAAAARIDDPFPHRAAWFVARLRASSWLFVFSVFKSSFRGANTQCESQNLITMDEPTTRIHRPRRSADHPAVTSRDRDRLNLREI